MKKKLRGSLSNRYKCTKCGYASNEKADYELHYGSDSHQKAVFG